MIDREVFWKAWVAICQRFRIGEDDELRAQHSRYFAFLNDLLTTEEFQAGARMIWAAGTFFPRPVDFLKPKARADWDRCRREEPPTAMSPGGRALQSIGGLHALKEMPPSRLGKAWERYEQAWLEAAAEGSKHEVTPSRAPLAGVRIVTARREGGESLLPSQRPEAPSAHEVPELAEVMERLSKKTKMPEGQK